MAAHIDLHMHTDFSDGLLPAAKVLDMVREKSLVAFSVTDHDTLDGYRAVRELLREDDPELIPGIELSALIDGDDLHLLAYFIDPNDDAFNRSLKEFQENRNRRGGLIVEELKKLGLAIPFDEVLKTANGAVIGRPHIADTLFRLGLTQTYEDAFARYIGKNRPAYIPNARLSPEEAIDIVHRAGGVAVMAHPYISEMLRHVEELVPLGLDGIEVFHSSHARQQGEKLKQIAAQHNLVCTGGSDFHGREDRNSRIGSQKVPAVYLDAVRERVQSIRGKM